MTFVVTAIWTARQGEDERVLAALSKLIEPTREEPECLVYQVHRSLDDPCVFFLYEQYVDRAAYDAHGASEHFRCYAVGEGIPLLAGRERNFYETFEPGRAAG